MKKHLAICLFTLVSLSAVAQVPADPSQGANTPVQTSPWPNSNGPVDSTDGVSGSNPRPRSTWSWSWALAVAAAIAGL